MIKFKLKTGIVNHSPFFQTAHNTYFPDEDIDCMYNVDSTNTEVSIKFTNNFTLEKETLYKIYVVNSIVTLENVFITDETNIIKIQLTSE